MKLLAQFYACLAIIGVFTAVFNGIEARSTNGGLLAHEEEHKSPPKELIAEAFANRVRRHATYMTADKPDGPPKQTEHEEHAPQKSKRHAPEGPPPPPKQFQANEAPEHEQKRNKRHAPEGPPPPPKQFQADEAPEHEHKRNRRQAPPGMPNPEDMAKQMPMPSPGRK